MKMIEVIKIVRAIKVNDYAKLQRIISHDKNILYNVKLKHIKKLFWLAIGKNDSLMIRYLFSHLDEGDRIEAIAYTYNSYVEREYYKKQIKDYFEEFFAASVTYCLSEYISYLIEYVKDRDDIDSEKVEILVDYVLKSKKNPYAKKFEGKFNLYNLEPIENIKSILDENKKEYETSEMEDGNVCYCSSEWHELTQEELEELKLQKKREQEEKNRQMRENMSKTMKTVLDKIKMITPKKKNKKHEEEKTEVKSEVSWREKLDAFKKQDISKKKNKEIKRPVKEKMDKKVKEKNKSGINWEQMKKSFSIWQENWAKKQEIQKKEKAKKISEKKKINNQKTLMRKFWWEEQKKKLSDLGCNATNKMDVLVMKQIENLRQFGFWLKVKTGKIGTNFINSYKKLKENFTKFYRVIKRVLIKSIYSNKSLMKEDNVQELIEKISSKTISFEELNDFKKKSVIDWVLKKENIDFLTIHFDSLSMEEKRQTLLLVYKEDGDREYFIKWVLDKHFKLFFYTCVKENLYKYMMLVANQVHNNPDYDSEFNMFRDYLADCEVNDATYEVMTLGFMKSKKITLNILKSKYALEYIKMIRNKKELKAVLSEWVDINPSKEQFREVVATLNLGAILYDVLDNCALNKMQVSALVLEILKNYEERASKGLEDDEEVVENYIDALLMLNVLEDVKVLYQMLDAKTRSQICGKLATQAVDNEMLEIWMSAIFYGNCREANFLLVLFANKGNREIASRMLRWAPKEKVAHIAENLFSSKFFNKEFVLKEIDSLSVTNPENCSEVIEMVLQEMYLYFDKSEVEYLKNLGDNLQKNVGEMRKIKF